MASPGPPLKKSKRLKGKAKVKEEDDLPHYSPADTQDAGDAHVKRKMSKRQIAGRLGANDGEAGPSTQPQTAKRAAAAQQERLASQDELAHTIRQRDFYKAEAEEAICQSLSDTEKEQLIGAVMRHMLFRQKQKPDQPVRRDELAKLFQSAGCQGTGTSNYVIAHARARFANALGLEMKSIELIPNKMAGKPEAELRGLEVKGAKAYVLRSILPPKCRALVKAPDVHHGFFMLVLSLIDFSPSKKIPADVLWECLDGLCLREKEHHPTLGNPKDLLALMLKKRYIMEIIPGASDGPTKLYCAGENALDEIPQEQMDLFAAKVLREAAIEIPDEPSPENDGSEIFDGAAA